MHARTDLCKRSAHSRRPVAPAVKTSQLLNMDCVQEIDRVTEALDEECRSSAGLRSNCTYER